MLLHGFICVLISHSGFLLLAVVCERSGGVHGSRSRSLRRVKHLRSQTRLCRQTRHVALGSSQIYTQIAWEIQGPCVFFFSFVWVYMFLTGPLMSVRLCVCVFLCVQENSFCVSPPPLVEESHCFSVMNIYQAVGSWSLSVAGNLRLGTCF